jgi:hypothetical protein
MRLDIGGYGRGVVALDMLVRGASLAAGQEFVALAPAPSSGIPSGLRGPLTNDR